MNPEPQHRVIVIEVWLAWAHGLGYGGAGKSSDQIAMDHSDIFHAHRILRAPDRSGTTSVGHEAGANSACTAAIELDRPWVRS